MKSNNFFYTASYFGFRLEKLFPSKGTSLECLDWDRLKNNSDYSSSEDETNHILFYDSLLKVATSFYNKNYEIFSGQEMYGLIRYIIMLLFCDILRDYSSNTHMQFIKVVFSRGVTYLFKNVERDNEKFLEDIVEKIDLELYINELITRYSLNNDSEEEVHKEILEQIRCNEYLPKEYIIKLNQFFQKDFKRLKLSDLNNNELKAFKLYDFSLKGEDISNEFYINKEIEEFSIFLKTIPCKQYSSETLSSKRDLSEIISRNYAGYSGQSLYQDQRVFLNSKIYNTDASDQKNSDKILAKRYRRFKILLRRKGRRPLF